MDYLYFKGTLLGFLLLFVCFISSGIAIRCFTCDVTSSASYADANDKCNQDGSRECPTSEDTACMLEGFLRESNTVRVSKKCMRGCPLYINTTAEVVRCCTEDGCNAKFEPMPARRPSLPPRGYNPNRGYNVPNQGTNRPFQPNTIDIKRMEQLPGRGVSVKEMNKPIKSTPVPENDNNVTSENDVKQNGPDTKQGKDKINGKKKLDRKQANERNSLAEQKSKKTDSMKASSDGTTWKPSCDIVSLAMFNILLTIYFKL